MYRVPPDLDLSAFVGATLNQVALGPHDLQLHFDRASPAGAVAQASIWGRFELYDPGGAVLEAGQASDLRTKRLPDLLGTAVVDACTDPPLAVVFTFATGHRLRLVDDTDQYECFALEPGGVIV